MFWKRNELHYFVPFRDTDLTMSRTYLADEVETLDLSPIEKVTQTSMLHSVATIDTEIATLSQKARKYTLKNE